MKFGDLFCCCHSTICCSTKATQHTFMCDLQAGYGDPSDGANLHCWASDTQLLHEPRYSCAICQGLHVGSGNEHGQLTAKRTARRLFAHITTSVQRLCQALLAYWAHGCGLSLAHIFFFSFSFFLKNKSNTNLFFLFSEKHSMSNGRV